MGAIVCHVDDEDGERCDRGLKRRIRQAEREFSHECPRSPDAARLGAWTHSLSERVIESVDGRQTPTAVLEAESDELFAEFCLQFCSAVTEG